MTQSVEVHIIAPISISLAQLVLWDQSTGIGLV